jgi:hypothetical protein
MVETQFGTPVLFISMTEKFFWIIFLTREECQNEWNQGIQFKTLGCPTTGLIILFVESKNFGSIFTVVGISIRISEV